MNGCEALSLRLPVCPDPVAAYAAFSDRGSKPGTALLESASPGHAGTQRSVLALSPALRISLQGGHISIRACNANGAAAVRALGGMNGEMTVEAPPAACEPRDEDTRLREPSVLDALRDVLAGLAPRRPEDRAHLRLIGALAFELARRFDDMPAENMAPDYVFTLPDIVLEIDHARRGAVLTALAFDDYARNDLSRRLHEIALALDRLPDFQVEAAPKETSSPKANCDDHVFQERVDRGKAAVRAGEVFQVVLSRYWTVPCDEPLAAYARLRRDNPSPYLFYLADEALTLFGASPESAVRFDARTRELEIHPVAGTRPRGVTPDEDARLEAELRLNAKEVAEHMMLVDLARNDIARVCVPGTRTVTALMGVDRYAHVMHLVSCVRGRLRDDLDALHALRACLNMGTLSGAPKHRAVQLIHELEQERRGFYGGAVGVLDAAGNLDTAITIRAGIVTNGHARVQAGAGVVHDSDPRAEAEETRQKARAVLRAITGGGA